MVICFDIYSCIYFHLKNQYLLLNLFLFPIVVIRRILPKILQYQRCNVDIFDAITYVSLNKLNRSFVRILIFDKLTNEKFNKNTAKLILILIHQ